MTIIRLMKLLRIIADWGAAIVGMGVLIFPELPEGISYKIRLSIFIACVLYLTIPRIFPYLKRKFNLWVSRMKVIKIGISVDDSFDDELVNYCNEEVTIFGLASKIKFRKFTSKKNDINSFQKLVRDPNVDVVVSCPKDKRVFNRIPLSFTYKNTADNLIARIVHAEMSSLISKEKMFALHRGTLSIDLHLEKSNIANFALYIVAICTTLFRGNNDGIFVFEKLHTRVKQQGGLMEGNVARRLKDLYFVKGSNLLSRNKYVDSLICLEKALALDSNNPDILAAIAFAKFQMGDQPDAEKISEDLLQNHTNHPVAHLNGAFFRVKNKKYSSALKHYLIFGRINNHPATCLEAITFLSKRLYENPKELGYLFARGFLKRMLNKENYQLTKVGESNYLEDLVVFAQRADKKLYKEMIEVAEKYITAARKTKKNWV